MNWRTRRCPGLIYCLYLLPTWKPGVARGIWKIKKYLSLWQFCIMHVETPFLSYLLKISLEHVLLFIKNGYYIYISTVLPRKSLFYEKYTLYSIHISLHFVLSVSSPSQLLQNSFIFRIKYIMFKHNTEYQNNQKISIWR